MRLHSSKLLFYSIIFNTILLSQNLVQKDGFAFNFPEKGYEGTPMAFDVSPANPEYLYLWEFGHSSQYSVFNWRKYEDRSMGSRVEFTYPGQGKNNGYIVKVEIYKNNISKATKVTEYETFIPVYNVPPTVTMVEAPIEGVEGERLFFKASHTDPSAVDKHTYYWNFGDDTNQQGPFDSYDNSNQIEHEYYNDGLFNIMAIAMDDDGDADTIYHQITIKNVPPVLENIKHKESANEGERVSFRSEFSDQGINDIHTFVWNFGDGNVDTSFNNLIDYTYEDNDTYEIELIIFDEALDSDTIKSEITIQNVAPKIKGVIPKNAEEGKPVFLSLVIYDEGENDTHKIYWDLGDGIQDSTMEFTHQYVDDGEYTINISVEDDDGGTDVWVQKITIFNVAPTLEFSIPNTASEGDTLKFEVNATDLGINDTFTYLWNFGDGTIDSVQAITKVYKDNGDYKIYVTVKDDDNGSVTEEKNIIINNVPPTLSATIPLKQYEGSKVEISANVASDPGTDDTHTFTFNYGDGTISEESSHIYQDNDDYEIEIILSDDDGGSDTLKQNISIINLPPKILGELPNKSNEGQNLNFQITIEDPGNLDTHTYFWDYGDGSYDSTLLTQHVYQDNGEYKLMVRVIDDDGGVDSLEHLVNVLNLPPILSASFTSSSKVQIPEDQGGSKEMDVITQTIDISQTEMEHSSPTGDRNASVIFNASVIDSGLVDTHTFSWDFGDGTTSTEANIEHIYSSNGVFPITMIVMDDDYGSDTLSQTIMVTNVTPALGATLLTPDSLYQSIIILPLDVEGAKEGNTFSWDFGDGDTTKASMPTHAYNENGDYLLTARVIDLAGNIGLNFKKINVNGRHPSILPFEDDEELEGLVDSGNSLQFFSKDYFSISSRRQITYSPNSFPTLVYTLENFTDKKTDVNINLILPDGWKIISLNTPETLEAYSKERVRVTFYIPNNEKADNIHKIRLITQIGDYDHMVSIMSGVDIKIHEKPAFGLEAYRENEEIFINKKQGIKYLIENMGNVTDTYSLNAILPKNWELINLEQDIQLAPGLSKEFEVIIKSPKVKHKSIEDEIILEAVSKKLSEKIGIWSDAIEERKGFCSDSYSEHCSIDGRNTPEDCEIGSIWNPEIEPIIQHCSDSLFTNKEDCERELEWIEGIPGTLSTCTDTTYTTLSKCVDNNATWIAGTADTDGYCSESKINTRKRCEQANIWFSTVRGIQAFCKSFPERKSEEDCLAIGSWTETFNGTETEKECKAVYTWHPEKLSQEEYCTESYWNNKEDCESISKWVLSEPAIETGCVNPLYTTKEECEKDNVWLEAVPIKPAYCPDGISKNLVDCNSPGEWFPSISSDQAYCTDGISQNLIECEKITTWTPEIEARDAFCSDISANTQEDCGNPPGMKISSVVNLFSRLKAPEGKSNAMFASLPVQLGVELGNLSSKYYPSSKISAQTQKTKIGPYTTWFKYSQMYNQYELSDSIDASESSQQYLDNYTVDRLQFYLSRDNWEIILGDNSVDKFNLISKLSPVPMFGLNGFESFRGAQFNYKFSKFDAGFNYGSGPTFSKEHNLVSVSIGSKQNIEKTTFYGAYYQNKTDSASMSHFIDLQRIKKSDNFNTGQIFALTHKDSIADGSAQFIFEYSNPKYKITSRSYFIGPDFDDEKKGRQGSDLTSNIKFNEQLYNFSRIQIYKQDLYESTPIYTYEKFIDSGDGKWNENEVIYEDFLNALECEASDFSLTWELNGEWDEDETIYNEFLDEVECDASDLSLTWDPEYRLNEYYCSDENDNCGYLKGTCFMDKGICFRDEVNGQWDPGEVWDELNDNGKWDADTTYIERVLVADFNDKIFFQFKNGLRVNTGYKYRYSTFSNEQHSKKTEVDLRLIKNFNINSPYLSAVIANEIDIVNDQYSRFRFEMGNRSIFENLNMNFNQLVSLETYGPLDSLKNSYPNYQTSFDARFRIFKLNWNFHFLVENLCPLCTGEEEKSVIKTLALESSFSLNILGVKNRIRLGVGYSNNGLNLTFGLTPTGGSHSSKIRIPVPLIKIKGRYQGEIFIDNNGNGIREVNEPGVPNLMLFVNGDYSVTNEDGKFEFGALEPGRYNLSFDPGTLDAKYKFADDFPYPVTITKGSKDFDSFPVSPICKIKGTLYIDSDLDNNKDLNEKVIDEARLIVQDNTNNEIIVYTDSNGRFEIPDLKTGIYNLIVDPEWLPERTVVTFSPQSKKIFTKLGWPVTVSNENSTVEFNIPINEKELEVRVNVRKDTNGDR